MTSTWTEVFWWSSRDLQPEAFACLNCDFIGSIQVDFKHHVIWLSVAIVTSVTAVTGGVEVLSQQFVVAVWNREAEAWIKVSSLWHSKCPRWGEGKGKSHTQNTEHTELAHSAHIPAVATDIHMEPHFCWITEFRLLLTNPPFLYFFLHSGI